MSSRPSRSLCRWLFCVIVVLTDLGTSAALAQDVNKRVLALYATRRDSEFSLIGESTLPRTLDVGLAQNLDYYSEFIDQARFSDPNYRVAFGEFLRLKYQGVRFDLVVALQDASIEFVNDHRDTLFAGTPVVFLSNTPVALRAPNSTGLIHDRDFTGTLTLLAQLQPDATDVFVVTGAARSDKEYENVFRRQVASSDSGRLTFTYLSGLRTDALEERLANLPARSAVYYLLVTQDGHGDRFHPLEYVDRVAAAANAPTYCWVESAMGHGILGGSLYSQRNALERVGELGLRVLRGQPADSIPVATLDLNKNQVDWRQLRRWGINEARVPAGTIVSFRDPTIWDRYKGYILAAVALLLIQSVLITGLLVQRSRRRQAEGELRRSQGQLLRSYERNRDLGVRLLRAQETERSRIARELHDDICQRMLLLTIELETLGGASQDERPDEALTMARGIAKSLHELSHQLHPTKLRLIGLVAALDHLRLELSRVGIAISFTHDNVPSTLSPDVMLCLFRVVQEALQNAIKYSNANALSVLLQGTPGELTLTVLDNGSGFDVETAWGKGVGLLSMAERLEAIGGSLDIHSHPGAGTQLTATVPLEVMPSAGATGEPPAARAVRSA